MTPTFTLAVVASADGFIARDIAHAPVDWASPEEQALFLTEVANADWTILGRRTHQAADRPYRRRIVFSRTKSGWLRPTQLWLDPADLAPFHLAVRVLAARVNAVRPLKRGLILGGTGVHDWFNVHRAIDRVRLTIEPVEFGSGLTIFPGAVECPLDAFLRRGYRPVSDEVLNRAGTRIVTLVRC